MSVFLQPLQTVTVGSGGASSVSFNSIPQGYTDLKLVCSFRGTASASGVDLYAYVNNVSSDASYSTTYLTGTGSATGSSRATGLTFFYLENGDAASQTANTFSSHEVYFPNYTGSNYKQIIVDTVNENNGSVSNQGLAACLWAKTTAISALTVFPQSGNIAQYSTFALYGVLRQGI